MMKSYQMPVRPTSRTASSQWPATLATLLFVVTALSLNGGLACAPAAPQSAVQQILEEGSSAALGFPATLADRERLNQLYAANGYRLLWSANAAPTSAARQLMSAQNGAAARGLNPEDYRGAALAAELAALSTLPAPRAAEGAWAEFDVQLSLAGLRLVSDLHSGRVDPATVGHNLTVARVAFDVPAALANLATAADVGAALDALEPQFTHYALLKRQLARYRMLAGQTGLNDLPPLPPGVKSLKSGDAYAGAGLLQRLLAAVGDGPPAEGPAPASLTPALSAALARFQSRHGEQPDGRLGAATLAELRKPLAERVRQIELTLERWRWLPADFVSAPIIVNIPQFRLFAFESTSDSEATMRQMDVIVGKAFQGTQTPVFAADMTYLIFRPYWEVPYSIAVKEIVPAARRNSSYLDKHQMELVKGGGDGATVMQSTRENVELLAKGVLRVRQKPGRDNSLGLVKFMFPNPYNVYLHSTPAQSLFAEPRRDFSHGCVRVSDPVGLAQYVLRDSPEWTRERIEAAMNGTETLTVNLKKHIRVFIVYGTALATEDGRILFFDDIYGHDRRLEGALMSRQPRPPDGVPTDTETVKPPT